MKTLYLAGEQADIIEETLTNDSLAYNVVLRTDSILVSISCNNLEHAKELQVSLDKSRYFNISNRYDL